jgi:hypothetical protein
LFWKNTTIQWLAAISELEEKEGTPSFHSLHILYKKIEGGKIYGKD